MLYDLLYEFEHHELDGDEHPYDTERLVLESYTLKPGVYFRVHGDGKLDRLFVPEKDGDVAKADTLYGWFQPRDLVSSLVNLNKSVDKDKQIHSNNAYTVFCKLEKLLKGSQLNTEIFAYIDCYYQCLLNPSKPKDQKLLDISGYTPLDPKFVEACKCQICTSIENIAENVRALKLKKDCYIRIFLDANEDDYQHEGGRYLVTKIFNSNKYNLWIGNTVLGLSDSNMGMNSKKPYQAHSSTKFKVPFRVDARSAISLRKLFLWLGSRRNENGWFLSEGYLPVRKHPAGLFKAMGDVNLPESVHYLHQQKKNDDTLIDDYDFLPRFSDSIPKPVEFQNHLDCAEFDGGKKDRLSEIEAMVDKYLFNFQLRKNYGDEKVTASGQLSGELAAQIMYTRHAWHAWFRKGDAIPIAACIDRATMGPMVARLKDLETLRVMKSTMSQMLNTRFALLSYFSNKEDQDMGNYYQQQYELLKEKVQSDVSDAFGESSAEFYLATGQLLYYMMCCREGQNINYDLALRDFITARNAQVVKDQLLKKWRPTMYKDTIWNPRFNKLLSIVRTYNAPAKELVDIDALIAGFCNKNLVYMKKEEQTHEEN